jgi:hypothetical protein
MIKKEVTQTATQYSEKCKVCGKIILGTSEAHVEWNMGIHELSKHGRKK